MLGWASEHGVVKVSTDFILLPQSTPAAPSEEVLVPQAIPKSDQLKLRPERRDDRLQRDLDYLRQRNEEEMKRREKERDPAHRERERQKEIEEEERERQAEKDTEEEEEEEEEAIDLGVAIGETARGVATAIKDLKTGVEPLDQATQQLRGIVQENIPSELHDLFYLALAICAIALLSIFFSSLCRCSRIFASEGKSD